MSVTSAPKAPSPALEYRNLRIHENVQAALASGRAVVALESTIIAHGMPFPDNLRNAHALEEAVRANGAVPATVAVLRGVPHIGLSRSQLHLLSTDDSVRKLARRDLPAAVAQAANGATTVSATMFLSSLAGIRVFATGGIGGVHRGVANSFDISADIPALATISQIVVCAGVKSILDIPKTLEALETAGVPVLVLDHDQFPAFYTRDSGIPAPLRIYSDHAAAQLFLAAHATGAAAGVLLAVPVPKQFEADAALVQHATEKALLDMKTENLRPNQVTPFLLGRIAELTDGASLQTNMHLARNNACVAARVAVHLSRVLSTSRSVEQPLTQSLFAPLSRRSATESTRRKRVPLVMMIGGTALDIHCDASQRLVMHSSNAGRVRQCVGGVGKNIAHAAKEYCDVGVKLISCIGDDAAGWTALSMLNEAGLETNCVKQYAGRRTGVCCVVHDHRGDLTVAVADFEDMFNCDESFVDDVEKDIRDGLESVKFVCMDANFSAKDMKKVVELSQEAKIPVWFEPTTSVKCKKVVEANIIGGLRYMSPNESELRSMAAWLSRSERNEVDGGVKKWVDSDEGCIYEKGNTEGMTRLLVECAETMLRAGNGLRILCTRGSRGVTRFTLSESGKVEVMDFASARIRKELLRNTTGAGDCFAGCCLAEMAKGRDEDWAIQQGIIAAAYCCMGEEAVPRQLESVTSAKL